MTNRTSLMAGVVAAVAIIAPAGVVTPATAADEVTVVAWGGATQDAMRKVYFDPFEESTGIQVLEDSWNGGVGVLRAKVLANAVNWDIVEVESEELVLGCEEGLYVPVDWERVGGREQFLESGTNECGVGMLVWSTVLAYDRGKLADGPASWKDFWDLDRFPGKRGLRRGPKFSLEFALYADGVEPAHIYDVLRTPEGVDRAFRKLDEIKPLIVWWEAGAQPQQFLASGQVAMTSAYSGRVTAANWTEGMNFGVVWPGSMYAVDSWVILQGSPNPEAAMDMVAFMSQAERQALLPTEVPYGTTNRDAAALIPDDLLSALPTAEENLAVQLEVDTAFWVENVGALEERFTAWLAE